MKLGGASKSKADEWQCERGVESTLAPPESALCTPPPPALYNSVYAVFGGARAFALPADGAACQRSGRGHSGAEGALTP
eukprot:scaffold23037_cov141-Isochrysis_galbana.AAC.1